MRDDEALLAAIVAHPDEDTPRLAFADWLDEHRPDARPSPAQGPSARAELVRVQCRLARLTADDDFTDLQDQSAALFAWLNQYDPLLAEKVGAFAPAEGGDDAFARGFPFAYEIEFTSASARALARAERDLKKLLATTTARAVRASCDVASAGPAFVRLPALEPVSRLNVTAYYSEMPDLAPAIAAAPHLRNLKHLSTNSALTDADARAFAGAKHLATLEEFSATCGDLSPDGLRALAAAPWFRNLKRLALYGLTEPVLEALCALPPFPRLSALNLADNNLRTEGVAVLARSKAFPHLRELDLARNPFGPEGVEALVRAKQWELAALDVRACGLRTAGAVALAAWPGLRDVRILDAAANAVGAKGVAALARSPHASALRHLDLGYNHYGQSGLLAVADAAPLRNVTSLDVCADLPDAAGTSSAASLQAFFERLDMPNLRHLILNRHKFPVAAVRALAACASLSRLQVLDATECNLTDTGLKALAESPHLRELVAVDLTSNAIGDGARVLRDRAVWPKLATARLYRNKVQPGALKRLVGNRAGVRATI